MKNTFFFHFKGYDRVIAIHKIKKSINKFGDKLGKKNNILKNIKRQDALGKIFVNLTINNNKINEKKQSSKIPLLNKKIQNNGETYKNEESTKKRKIDTNAIKTVLEDEKTQNDNEPEQLSNSYDFKPKETKLFSKSNKRDYYNKILINDLKNKDFSSLNVINMKKYNIIGKIKHIITFSIYYIKEKLQLIIIIDMILRMSPQ